MTDPLAEGWKYVYARTSGLGAWESGGPESGVEWARHPRPRAWPSVIFMPLSPRSMQLGTLSATEPFLYPAPPSPCFADGWLTLPGKEDAPMTTSQPQLSGLSAWVRGVT